MKVTTNTPPQTSQTQSLDKAKSVDKANVNPNKLGEAQNTSSGTQVDISDQARLLQRATQLVNGLPDVQAEKVAALKQSIANGSYRVDSAAIAEKILDEHFNTDFGKNSL